MALSKPNTALTTFGEGCNSDTINLDLTTGGTTNTISFDSGGSGGQQVLNNDYIIIRVTYGATFAHYIDEIDLSSSF